MTYNIAAISIIFLVLCQYAHAFNKSYPPGSIVKFETVATPEDIEFARTYLRKYFEAEKPVAWDRAIRDGEISIARADLDDDGVPEVVLMTEHSCGSIGCDGLLLKKRGGQWTLMASPFISEEATIVINDKRFGYHKLYTGDSIYTFRNGKTYDIQDTQDGSITRQ
jgi:hypothetical protein